jgi:predicted aspartyl protease
LIFSLDQSKALWQIVWPMRLLITFAFAAWVLLGANRPVNAQQNFSATQAILSSGLHLFVPVSINGTKRTWWLIDTGAPGSLIAPSLQQKLSLPAPPGQTDFKATVKISGKNYPLVLAQSVDLNGAQIGPGYLAVAPIDVMEKEKTNALSGGFDKGGLIGMNFLLKRGALINYKTYQVFLSLRGSALPLSREGYEKMGYAYVPLRITPRGYVEVEGTIGGSTYSFLLDTGSFVSQLEPKIRERNHLAYDATRALLTAPYAGLKKVRLTQSTVPGFKIGTQDLSDFRIGFAESHTFDPGFLHEYGGILGPDLFHFHAAIIDLGNRALYLKPDYRSRKR